MLVPVRRRRNPQQGAAAWPHLRACPTFGWFAARSARGNDHHRRPRARAAVAGHQAAAFGRPSGSRFRDALAWRTRIQAGGSYARWALRNFCFAIPGGLWCCSSMASAALPFGQANRQLGLTAPGALPHLDLSNAEDQQVGLVHVVTSDEGELVQPVRAVPTASLATEAEDERDDVDPPVPASTSSTAWPTRAGTSTTSSTGSAATSSPRWRRAFAGIPSPGADALPSPSRCTWPARSSTTTPTAPDRRSRPSGAARF
jgi:hypothetical protein